MMERLKAIPRKVLPIINWLPEYNGEKALRDLIAGLTVGLTVIPQGLAYAVLAGLPTQYGLYSSFMGVFVYCFLGTSKDISLGPTAIMSMLVAVYCGRPDSWPVEYPPQETTSDPILAIHLTMLTGIVLVVLGLLNLGFVVNFISHAVIVGFCSSASIIISAGQIKKIFGIELHHREFFHMMPELAKEIVAGNINWYDFGMGLTCLVALKLLELLKRRYNGDKSLNPIVSKIIWIVGTARNAIVVIIALTAAYIVEHNSIDYWRAGCKSGTENCTRLTLTKIADASMPGIHFPQFSYSYNYSDALTGDIKSHNVSFSDIISCLSSGLFIIPLMAYLESISIAKGFAIKNSYKVDPTQELVAIGTSNFLSSLIASYPVTGSFSRTAVNSQSNVASPAGGVVCGSLVLLALLFLTPIFVYIPTACLGSVIILAAISMFDFAGIKHTWALSKLDALPMGVVFLLCFWDIAYGIIAGIVVHLGLLLYKVSKPEIQHIQSSSQVVLKPKQGLYYPVAEYLVVEMEKVLIEPAKSAILDLSHIREVDAGVADAIKTTLKHVESCGCKISVTNANDTVLAALKHAGATDYLPYDKVKPEEESLLRENC